MQRENLPLLQKQQAANMAATLIENNMVVGLGTGSTAALFLAALARRVQYEELKIVGVPTSHSTAQLAQQLGITITDEAWTPDIVVDGADECDPHGVLIKGGGGALLREKIVASAGKRMVVLVDDSKCVLVLGKFALPVEVLPWGADYTIAALTQVAQQHTAGALPVVRPQRSDNGNLLVDLPLQRIDNPQALSAQLLNIAGVIECGLFLNQAHTIICGDKVVFQR
jgi:ribose 5-phosphate isomerase A